MPTGSEQVTVTLDRKDAELLVAGSVTSEALSAAYGAADIRLVKAIRRALDASPQPPAEEKGIAVVVSGHRVWVCLSAEDTIAGLMRRALELAGIKVRVDLAEWQLRTLDGTLVSASDPTINKGSQRVTEAGLPEGQALFLDPEAGGGADAR